MRNQWYKLLAKRGCESNEDGYDNKCGTMESDRKGWPQVITLDGDTRRGERS